MTEILYVCSANICRSAMAEVITNEVYGAKFHASSAGISASGTYPMQYDAKAALGRAGYDISRINHVSRRVTGDIIDAADIVVCVNHRYAALLRVSYPEFADKITSFAQDIDAPSDGDADGFDRCFYALCDGIEKLLCPEGFRG